MQILITDGWEDFQLLDSGNGRRLERYGNYVLSRPDPQAIWLPFLPQQEWDNADAIFKEDKWQTKNKLPDKWKIVYKNISLWARPTPFKHTGIFPEQHLQWDFITNQLKKSSSESQVLNLFGYTGAASLVAAAHGARVTHVDASRPAIGWTKENQELSGLSDKPIRWILEDAVKFVKREIRRRNAYDGIIMDPPAYGHGPEGEKWDFHENLEELLTACQQVLTQQPLFIVINAYAISSSAIMLHNMLEDMMKKFSGTIEYGELALKEKSRDRLLSTGIFARWHS